MKQSIKFVIFCLVCCQVAAAQIVNNSVSKPSLLNVSFADSNVRYKKDVLPTEPSQNSAEITGWRGERLNAQFLVWGSQNISDLAVSVSEFKSAKGVKLNPKSVKAQFVKYVITDTFHPCGKHKIEQYGEQIVADIIDNISTTDVKAKNVQPVWLTVDIPQTAQAGVYTGKISIKANDTKELVLKINVVNQVLPSAAEWSFDLDLWQHPAAIARVHKVELWSDEHFRLMRPYYEMLARAGQKNITTAIIEEPWGHQTYDDFPSLIKWTKKKDGSWEYDYKLFDKYVEFVMSCGINKRINAYTMIPWGLKFAYFDEAQNKNTFVELKTESPEYRTFWKTMLTNFTKHLKAKNWFEKTSISVDERPLKAMQTAIEILREVDPKWKIAMAGDYHPELEDDVFDYSIASASLFKDEKLAERKKAGKPSTFYTCCVEPYPNGFTFSPPAEHVWLGWYAAHRGFTGYLRWAYNSWTEKPLEDSRFTAWSGGDTYQIYPGPRTSIRFEKLIEGIQDFEKIKILRNKYQKSKNSANLNELNQILGIFKIESLKTIPAKDMVFKAKQVINNISQKVSKENK